MYIKVEKWREDRFFRFSRKMDSATKNFFDQISPPDQDGTKKINQIGPAVPEEIDYMHTKKHRGAK